MLAIIRQIESAGQTVIRKLNSGSRFFEGLGNGEIASHAFVEVSCEFQRDVVLNGAGGSDHTGNAEMDQVLRPLPGGAGIEKYELQRLLFCKELREKWSTGWLVATRVCFEQDLIRVRMSSVMKDRDAIGIEGSNKFGWCAIGIRHKLPGRILIAQIVKRTLNVRRFHGQPGEIALRVLKIVRKRDIDNWLLAALHNGY
jgi:hypothetical protein